MARRVRSWIAVPAVSLGLLPFVAAAGPFDGGYAGLQGAAFGSGKIEMEEADNGETLSFGITSAASRFDVVAGGGVHEGSIYWGGEVAATVGGELDGAVGSFEGAEVDSLDFELSDGYRAAARLGPVLREGTSLLYAKLGYGTRDLELSLSDGAGELSEDEEASGFGYGLGLEYRPQDYPLFLRIEGMRYEYGEETIEDLDLEVTEHTTDVAVGFTF